MQAPARRARSRSSAPCCARYRHARCTMTDTICILSGARAANAGSTRWPPNGFRPAPAGDRGGPNMARARPRPSPEARSGRPCVQRRGLGRGQRFEAVPPAAGRVGARQPAAPSALMSAFGSAVAPVRAAAAAVARARAAPCAAVRAAAPSPALECAHLAPALARQSRRARAVTMASLSPHGAWLFAAAGAAGLRRAAAPRLVAALARGVPRRAPPPRRATGTATMSLWPLRSRARLLVPPPRRSGRSRRGAHQRCRRQAVHHARLPPPAALGVQGGRPAGDAGVL